MSRFVSAGCALLTCLAVFGASAAERPASEAPIVVPKDADRVDIPETLRKAAKEFGLELGSVPAFHEQRNILELSYYGNRRGIPLPHKVSVLIEYGCKRFWIADQFPHPDPTTVAGPFKGNAIEKLDLASVMRDGLAKRNYGTEIQAINGLLGCDDAPLVKLGLEMVPAAMDGDVVEVENYLHYIESRLPARRETYVSMGLDAEVDAALRSMDHGRKRIAAVTVQPAERHYQPGYDPAREQRHGVGVLPEEAWGKVKGGLQAGLATPETLHLNEVVPVYFVIRNTTDAPLRVSIPGHTGNLGLRFGDSPRSGNTDGVGKHREELTHWALEPGHQTAVLCANLQIMGEGELRPMGSFGDAKPGKVTAWASITSREKWRYLQDGGHELVAVPDTEWKGSVTTAKRSFELLAEKVPFVPSPPFDLGENHGLKPVSGFPGTFDTNRAEVVSLGTSVRLYLNHQDDAHWLVDHHSHHTTLSWGPISADRLGELGLLAMIEENSRELLALPDDRWDAYRRVSALVTRARPLAALGLELVPEVEVPDVHRIPPDGLLRAVRDRRVELAEMGLDKEARAALELLTKIYPPLPPKDEFTVVATKELPPGLGDDAWGPENDGLRAATLMPKVIADGATENVRLFIRNTTERDIYLTVSDRPGYDYATATDPKGALLPSKRPLVYPSGFSGFIAPEYNPGVRTQHPPTTTLTKLLLKPGAVHELKTLTALAYTIEDRKDGGGQMMGFGQAWPDDKPAVTTVTCLPTEAVVTWHLHTANGAAYTKDLKKRTWPARGGWSGLLQTAPMKITLRAEVGG